VSVLLFISVLHNLFIRKLAIFPLMNIVLDNVIKKVSSETQIIFIKIVNLNELNLNLNENYIKFTVSIIIIFTIIQCIHSVVRSYRLLFTRR